MVEENDVQTKTEEIKKAIDRMSTGKEQGEKEYKAELRKRIGAPPRRE